MNNEQINKTMNKTMNGCKNKWLNEWINRWLKECFNKWMNDCMNECDEWIMDDWMNEWMNKWMNEWMNEEMNDFFNWFKVEWEWEEHLCVESVSILAVAYWWNPITCFKVRQTSRVSRRRWIIWSGWNEIQVKSGSDQAFTIIWLWGLGLV